MRRRTLLVGGLAQLPSLREAAAKALGLDSVTDPKSPSFGAIGDGSADDTNALQRALNSARDSTRTVVLTRGTYKVTRELVLPTGVSIVGIGAPLLRQATPGQRLIVGRNVVDCEINGVRCQGISSGISFDEPFALIDIAATQEGGYAGNIRIVDCEVFDAQSCISATYVEGLWIRGNSVHNFNLYGVLASASSNFHIQDNNIYESELREAGNSYGISATGQSSRGRVQRQCSIVNNHIADVPAWDGIMTHDTDDLLISGNTIINVRTGIDASGFESKRPIGNVIITGNYIRLTESNIWRERAALATGIIVTAGEGRPITGVVVALNVIEGAGKIEGGKPAGNVYGAIQLDGVSDTMINGNVIKDMGSSFALYGIGVYRPGDNLSITGNSVSGSLKLPGIGVRQKDEKAHCRNLLIVGNSVQSRHRLSAHTSLHRGVFEGVFQANSIHPPTLSILAEAGAIQTLEAGRGAFEPTIQAGADTTAVRYTKREGRYSRSGTTVLVQASLQWSMARSTGEPITLSGLPFVSASEMEATPVYVLVTGLKDVAGQIVGVISRSEARINFEQYSGGYTAPLTTNHLGKEVKMLIQAQYTVE
jgi:hypothetical protein